MAHYTTTIKTLIDTGFDFKLDTYPIFDENYRNTLNQKILNHYYENEIGFETPALFRFYLNSKLNEIMPFYNILYEKQLQLLQNIDKNVNITEDFRGSDTKNNTASSTNNSHSETETETENKTDTKTDTETESESSSNSSSSGSSSSKNLFQDTPQGQLSQTDIDNQTWATNLTLDSTSNENGIEDSSSSSGSSTNTSSNTSSLSSSGSSSNTSSNSSTVNENGTNNYIKSIIGNNGGRYNLDILADLQKNLMNVDLMIINDLNELFMQIF